MCSTPTRSVLIQSVGINKIRGVLTMLCNNLYMKYANLSRKIIDRKQRVFIIEKSQPKTFYISPGFTFSPSSEVSMICSRRIASSDSSSMEYASYAMPSDSSFDLISASLPSPQMIARILPPCVTTGMLPGDSLSSSGDDATPKLSSFIRFLSSVVLMVPPLR